jgi:hypothetical protein
MENLERMQRGMYEIVYDVQDGRREKQRQRPSAHPSLYMDCAESCIEPLWRREKLMNLLCIAHCVVLLIADLGAAKLTA